MMEDASNFSLNRVMLRVLMWCATASYVMLDISSTNMIASPYSCSSRGKQRDETIAAPVLRSKDARNEGTGP